jgi:choline dehydrogenase
MASVGIKDAGDFDNGKILGSQYFKLTISSPQQQRASSESSYLSAFKDLPSLTLYTHTLGKKVLFDDENNAIGVVVENTNMPFTLKATNEVILSAGAFQSPQLLMVSGIGPKATLEAHNIPVLHDNPNVGQNMVDHVWFGPAVRVKLETNSRWSDDPDYKLSVYEAFHKNHEGPLTSNGGDFGAFEKIPDDLRENFTKAALGDLAAYPDDYPEIEVSRSPSMTTTFRPKAFTLTFYQVRCGPHLPRRFPLPPACRRIPIRVHRRRPHGAHLAGQHDDPLR